jgi:glutamate racemase
VAGTAHIVITDSGLGGLAACAALEQRLRRARPARTVRLTYVNAWPFEDRGYNDLPDPAERARVFDAVLSRIAEMRPDRLVIACNTLSILYPQTAFSRHPVVPVQGIIDAGVDVFTEGLLGDATASLVLAGTKTTIESAVHRDRIAARGVDPWRVSAVAWHGLAASIERGVDSQQTAGLIDLCTMRAAEAAPRGGALLLGLCCTHYGYVAGRLASGLASKSGRAVQALDPAARLVDTVMADLAPPEVVAAASAAEEPGTSSAALREPAGNIPVELISKVRLDEQACHGIALLIEPVSAATARALLSYARVPDLF